MASRIARTAPAPLFAAIALVETVILPAALAAQPDEAPSPSAGPRVAVLEFVNASSDAGLEALGKGLQSMVTTDLAKVERLTLIERARLQDLLAEQNLKTAGLLDDSTAAKIGKLAGASHLLGGTYTAHGGSMRIDARLFSVETGEVLLAEEMTGEREAFFELEKSLVQKLVTALGLKLAAKERAGIARIHTADFEAFKTFSLGIAQFDQRKYDEALESLRAATQIDTEFNLARVTLDQYQELVAKIRTKAQSIEVSERELKKQQADQAVQSQLRVAERLVAIASTTGDASRLRRLAALSFLVGLYNPDRRNDGHIATFQDNAFGDHYDPFLVRCRLDVLAHRYLDEAQEAFPAAPLFTDGEVPPAEEATLETGLARRIEQLKGDTYRVGADEFAGILGADMRERLRLWELVAERAAAAPKVDTRRLIDALDRLSALHLQVGEVDQAAAALARASSLMKDAEELKRTAKQVEQLATLSTLLSRPETPADIRELLLLSVDYPANVPRAQETARRARGQRLLYKLNELRRVRPGSLWFLGGEPAALVVGDFGLRTGPRRERLQSDALRFYQCASCRQSDHLVGVGRCPRDEVDASFTLSYRPAADFRFNPVLREDDAPEDLGSARPEIAFAFGLHDLIAIGTRTEGRTRIGYRVEPHGYAIRFADGAVQLVRVGTDGPMSSTHETKMTLVQSGGRADGERLQVRVRVRGTAVTVDVDGRTTQFTLPTAAAASGFVGFHFRGQGYGEAADVKLR